jgi:hypothetical protein
MSEFNKPLWTGGRVVPDCFYTAHQSMSLLRLSRKQWAEWLEITQVRSITLGGEAVWAGIHILRALERPYTYVPQKSAGLGDTQKTAAIGDAASVKNKH